MRDRRFIAKAVIAAAITLLAGHAAQSFESAGDGIPGDSDVLTASIPSGPKREGLQPAKGKLLIATDRVKGPIFEESVILLIGYSPKGATGVIINRPTDIPIHALFPWLDRLHDIPGNLFLGGPVEPGKLIMLIKTPSPPEGAIDIIDDVFVSSDMETLKRMGRDRSPDEMFKLYSGYAGWGPHQLDTEILRGSWHLAEATAELIFDTPAEKIREKINLPFTMEVRAKIPGLPR